MTPPEQNEGFIKFALEHEQRSLEPGVAERAARLASWRRLLRQVEILGQDPSRYEGAGFGNMSIRLVDGFMPPGRRSFLITGTQTSGKENVELSDFALVEDYDYRRNKVCSSGLAKPSSEAMTHGAIYDLDATIRAVFHVHSPDIWHQADQLHLPETDPSVSYGTPEMAMEVRRQYHLKDLRSRSVLVMGGHQDGIMIFGESPDEAGSVLFTWLARAQLGRRSGLS